MKEKQELLHSTHEDIQGLKLSLKRIKESCPVWWKNGAETTWLENMDLLKVGFSY